LVVSFTKNQAGIARNGRATSGQSQAARPDSSAQSPGSSRVAGGRSATKAMAEACLAVRPADLLSFISVHPTIPVRRPGEFTDIEYLGRGADLQLKFRQQLLPRFRQAAPKLGLLTLESLADAEKVQAKGDAFI